MYNILIPMMFCASVLAHAGEVNAPVCFSEGSVPGEYTVDTGVVAGVLGLEGRAHGLHPLTVKGTGLPLSNPPGLLDFYRVFTTNHRHVESMRALARETRIEGPNTLRVHWPAADGRAYALTGVYRWTPPDTLDLETIVEAKEELPDFEVFLASYLSSEFPASFVYTGAEGEARTLVTAEEDAGAWQAFPRDAAAAALVKDGRWDIEPNPVDWAMRDAYALPLIFRRNEGSGFTLAVMSRPEDCFALLTPRRGDAHYSMYMSLFGRTLHAGETATARVRLVVGALDDAALLKRYVEFISGK